MTLQADGKIVAAGGYTNSLVAPLFVTRLNSNGSVDESFSNNGMLLAYADSFYMSDAAVACLVGNDNKTIVIFSTTQSSANNNVFGITRLTAEGLLDNTFGGTGIVKTDFQNLSNDYPSSVKYQQDGKIFVAGSTKNGKIIAICRYNTDGTIDQTFGSGGIDTLDISAGNDVINDFCFLEDGKILAVGQSNGKACVIRLLSNGKIDSTFNNSGVLTYNNSNGEVFINATLATSTKLLAGGLLKDANLKTQLAVAAYDFSLFSGVPSIYQNSQMDVFPNPTHDVINLTAEILDYENITVDIFDLSGRNIQQIKKGQLAKGKHYISIDSKEWKAGVYLIKVSSDGKTIGNKKIIKM